MGICQAAMKIRFYQRLTPSLPGAPEVSELGKNCMIAGQVGIAGSAILGDFVVIGGQAGISGHLVIGNNVKIGGGSDVINK